MLILTRHARDRLLKRLLKKRSLDIFELYNRLQDFIKEARFSYYPYNRFLLVKICNKKYCIIGKCLYKSNVKDIFKIEYKYIVDENLNLSKEINFSNHEFKYKYYDSINKLLYLGNRRPILVFTFRPKKKKD